LARRSQATYNGPVPEITDQVVDFYNLLFEGVFFEPFKDGIPDVAGAMPSSARFRKRPGLRPSRFSLPVVAARVQPA